MSTSGNVAEKLQGAASQNILDLFCNTSTVGCSSSSTPVAYFDDLGNLYAGTINSATITGGTLSSTSVDGLNVSSTAVGATGALTVSSGGSSLLTLTSGSGNISTSATINSQTISSAANFTGTIALATLSSTTGNTAVCWNGSNLLADCGTNAAGVTLQDAYNISTTPQIDLNSSPGTGALEVRDTVGGLGGTLFAVQNNGGTSNYLGVSATGITTTGTVNGATISGGTLSGGTQSGSTLSATGLTFSGSTDTITGPSASNITLDTTGSATLNLGNANATTVTVGNSGSTTSINGSSIALQTTGTISANSYISQTISSSTATAFNQNVTSGTTGQLSLIGQTATNSNTTATATTVNGYSVTLHGTANTNTGTNVLNGILLNNTNYSTATNNTFNGIYFGSGYTNGIDFTTSTGFTDFIVTPTFDVAASGVIQDAASDTLSIDGASSGTATVANIVQGSSGQSIATFTNSSGKTVAQVDSSGNLDLGSTGNFTGNLIFENSTGSSGTVTLSSDVATSAASYTLDLPTQAPSATGACLEDTTSTSQLGFVNNCISGHNSADIVVPAEYVGAVLDAAGDSSCSSADIGTMTSASTGSSSPANENYYQWTTSLTSTECYDVVVQVPLPSDFGSFNGAPTIYAEGSSGSVSVEPLTCSGSVDSNYSGYSSITSPSTLAQEPFPSVLGSSYSSCGYVTLRIRLNVTAAAGTAEAGLITIPYSNQLNR